MSDEVFRRSQVGHSANDLHRHGGIVAPAEQKTERENLEEAIEALNDSEETENLVDIEKDMKSDNGNAFVDGFKASEPTKEESLAFDQPKVEEIKEEPKLEDTINIDPIEAAENKPIEPEKTTPIEVKEIPDDLVDDIEEAIEEVEKDEEKPVTITTKSEPINGWKLENRKTENVETAPEKSAKKSGGSGWKIATIIFAIIALALGCFAAYVLLTDTKIELAGRVVTSADKNSKNNKPATNNTPETPVEETPKFNFDEQKVDYKSLVEQLAAKKETLIPNKVDITKDGKYYYVFGVVDELEVESGGFYALYAREAKSGAAWKTIQAGQTLPVCSEINAENKKFMESYKYIDDEFPNIHIGCWDENGEAYPDKVKQ
ncbi:MAG: hypothetical protein MJ154_03415 [Candidatus Saccharibacteria bacterium]|nr:hypothetical protein [Candidatus Saccharibacteria bacterium]